MAEQERVPRKLEDTVYSQVFITLQGDAVNGIFLIAQTGMRPAEVLDGLASDDVRLREALLKILAE